MKISFLAFLFVSLAALIPLNINAQVNWINADAEFGPLPQGFNVYKTTDSLDGQPFIAYYATASLKNKKLQFHTDTTFKRRLTPQQFYVKNEQPLLVVNSTFFSFATNQNLNLVIREGKVVSYNTHTIPLKGKDTLQYKHPFSSAIGISKKRDADIAWTFTDSSHKVPYAFQMQHAPIKDSSGNLSLENVKKYALKTDKEIQSGKSSKAYLKKWKMYTAVGGGPVLVQDGRINITNNEEMKFAGKAFYDKHPRTLMGYTKEGKIIVMVIEGRNPGKAAGANLQQAAILMAGVGCVEALNLDGGGSSCMLINGKQTIEPSDKGVQRSIPAVFLISN
jgi:exopolysaccharide biosynthesis protein